MISYSHHWLVAIFALLIVGFFVVMYYAIKLKRPVLSVALVLIALVILILLTAPLGYFG